MQKCELTGKGKQYGSNVSFSQRHTKKVWKPNLQTKTLVVRAHARICVASVWIRAVSRRWLITPPSHRRDGTLMAIACHTCPVLAVLWGAGDTLWPVASVPAVCGGLHPFT